MDLRGLFGPECPFRYARINGMAIARYTPMTPEEKEAQERRDAAPARDESPDPEPSDYNLPFTD